MYRANERRAAMTHYIKSLWRNWAVSTGLTCGVIVMSLFVSRFVLPVAAFAFAGLLMAMMRVNRKSDRMTCFRIPYIATVTLFVTGVALVVLNFWLPNASMELTGQPINHAQPYLPNMIIAPVFAVTSFIYVVSGRLSQRFCRECNASLGSSADIGFIGQLFSKEATFQTRLLFGLSLLVAISEWVYYFVCFVTVNLNRSDMFVFFWLPILIYLLSLVYLGLRYYYLWIYYCHNDGLKIIERTSTTSLRYLIISGDSVYLKKCDREGEKDFGEYDTPARVRLPFREKVSEHDAMMNFRSVTGIPDCIMKFLYNNSNVCTLNNAYHYLCYISDCSEVVDTRIEGGEWLSLSAVNRLMQHRMLARDLIGEINRVYTVAIAWKTYDRQGNRLYSIKHYRPTFRLCDIKDWDVDFNDKHWLMVAANNEDRPFFKLRRWWRRVIWGKDV